MAKIALITGITGQDGTYLAELLLARGYAVHGIKRRTSLFNTDRVDHLFHESHEIGLPFTLHHGDMTDASSLLRTIADTGPDEIYNLAAQSHVAVSFEEPEYTANADALGTLRLLEAIRILGMDRKTRFYQASTSELFGGGDQPQTETTPFHPRSPYGVAKLYAHWITVNYREAYGLFACNGILFNHESPIRGETFVTRKVTRALARITLGMQECLYLGNLNARRDWGHARDYAEAMWLILQQPAAEDFVVATGEQRSVRDFVTSAAEALGIGIAWSGEGRDEVGVVERAEQGSGVKVGRTIVRVDAAYFRPAEVEALVGEARKARQKLQWAPKTSFADLVAEMTRADLVLARREQAALGRSLKVYRPDLEGK